MLRTPITINIDLPSTDGHQKDTNLKDDSFSSWSDTGVTKNLFSLLFFFFSLHYAILLKLNEKTVKGFLYNGRESQVLYMLMSSFFACKWYGSKAGNEKEEKIQEFVSGTFGFISCGYICMDGPGGQHFH